MPSCREVTELCSRALEQPLPFMQRWRLRGHLVMCSGCSNFRRQLFVLRDVARRYAQGDAPAAGDHNDGQK